MKLYHNSQSIHFRAPFGAAPTGSFVTLSLKIIDNIAPCSAFVRLWYDNCEHLLPMTLSSSNIYSADINLPNQPCLVWYYFIVNTAEKTHYYSANREQLGGIGEIYDSPPSVSYQITVYDSAFKTPDWFKNTIMYQIFPDRFYRDKDFSEIEKKRSEYTIHEDWYEPLSFNTHPYEDGPACNDFYGGTLSGITAKLDYLTELGIGTIYLNPIFEAYSNHRYDTADYSKVDCLLGTEDDFKKLCLECEARNIRVILDGVFSHTGSDSIYFNKYKSYGENVGAYQNPNSEYHSWYQWNGDQYESWWGCSNLPNINETEPTFIDYILTGEHAIIKKWLRLGAYGWRLDVADELPDEFIKTLRTQVKSTRPDAVIIGEVWEDASNKVSYGVKREYLLGQELDSVMNYPFKDSVLNFILGTISADSFARKIMSIIENYPFQALYSTMNIIGTHDTVRVKTHLSGKDFHSAHGNDFLLSPSEESLAIKRVKLAIFLQMTFIGVPCIYYGDEIGMQGASDPSNRMPFSWRCADLDLLNYCKTLANLRNSNDCLRCGKFILAYAENHVFAYWRKIESGVDVFGNKAKDGTMLCVVNRDFVPHEINLDCQNIQKNMLCGILTKMKLSVDESTIRLKIPGNSAEIFM